MAKENKDKKLVEKTLKQLLELLGVVVKEFKINFSDDYYQVSLITDDSAAIIGYHGENLSSLQLVTRLITYNQSGEWLKIIINVNDWKEKREEYLQQMAGNIAQKVKFSGKEYLLPLLSSAERRVIHLYLADYPDIESVSEGEGPDRRLVIRPRGN